MLDSRQLAKEIKIGEYYRTQRTYILRKEAFKPSVAFSLKVGQELFVLNVVSTENQRYPAVVALFLVLGTEEMGWLTIWDDIWIGAVYDHSTIELEKINL